MLSCTKCTTELHTWWTCHSGTRGTVPWFGRLFPVPPLCGVARVQSTPSFWSSYSLRQQEVLVDISFRQRVRMHNLHEVNDILPTSTGEPVPFHTYRQLMIIAALWKMILMRPRTGAPPSLARCVHSLSNPIRARYCCQCHRRMCSGTRSWHRAIIVTDAGLLVGYGAATMTRRLYILSVVFLFAPDVHCLMPRSWYDAIVPCTYSKCCSQHVQCCTR